VSVVGKDGLLHILRPGQSRARGMTTLREFCGPRGSRVRCGWGNAVGRLEHPGTTNNWSNCRAYHQEVARIIV